jgi:hypothetical protein
MKITRIIAVIFLLGAISSTILADEGTPSQQKPEPPDPPLPHYKSGKMPPAYKKQKGKQAPEHDDPILPKGWRPKHPSATNEIRG